VTGGTNLGFGRYQNYQMANIGRERFSRHFQFVPARWRRNNAPGYNEVAVAPLVESIQEFKVMTNFMPPEYGLTGGGIVTTVTKSGTNTLHGALYEFLRTISWTHETLLQPRAPLSLQSVRASGWRTGLDSQGL